MSNDYIQTIGDSLRNLRTYQKVSQKRLAKGICTQAYVSQIEKGDIAPSAHILYSFSQRLGVSINYFFDTPDNTIHEFQAEFIQQIREATKNSNYKEVLSMLNTQQTNPLFRTNKMKKFIQYHQGLCHFYLQHDFEKAILTLKSILSESDKHHNQEDLEITIAIANIYTEEKQFDEAKKYFEISFELLESRPSYADFILELRLYYNYIRYLYYMERYDLVLSYSNKGINKCSINETLSLHGEFYYYKGISLIKLGQLNEGERALSKAVNLFEITNKPALITYTKQTIEKYVYANPPPPTNKR